MPGPTHRSTVAQLPAIRPTLWGRLVRALSYVVRPQADEFVAGADYASESPATQGYPTANSMSAMSAFPWVRACVLAKAEDVAGLPSFVCNAKGERYDSHPMMDLLAAPASRTTWRWWAMQSAVDYELTGNAYSLLAQLRSGWSLLRWHPSRVAAVSRADGQIAAFAYDGSPKVYEWDDVVHLRGASWADGPEGLLGEGAIRSLHEDLTADLASKRQAASAAQRGRFEMLITPNDKDLGRWEPETVARIREKYNEMSAAGGGALVVGAAAKAESLSMTPRDLEYAESSIRTRDAVLGVFGVPPTRVGLPTANYATARQQMRTYWETLRGGLIATIEDALSRAARKMGAPGDRFCFDLSGVEALQESRSERLQRVSAHVVNGLPPAVAYALEGFDEAAEHIAAQPDPPPPPADDDRARALEVGREGVWRAWLDSVHSPAERRLARVMAQFFSEQAARYAEAVPELMPVGSRALSDDAIDALVKAADEMRRLKLATVGLFDDSAARAFARAARLLGISDMVYDPTSSPVSVLVSEFVATLSANTAEAVRQTIERGIVDGASIAEVQETLMTSQAFSPSRALRVARTETTKTVNAGADRAYQVAVAEHGVDLRKEWLTSRDAAVRESHQGMDGQTVDIGALFTSDDGQQANAPGMFGVAGEDINCRCTTLPVLEDG